MAIIYEQAPIAPAPGLVAGWAQFQPDTERLFAVYGDGKIVTTGWIDRTNSFDEKGRKWAAAAFVPGDAEFIGQYQPPAASRVA